MSEAQWYHPISWPGWGEHERLAANQHPTPPQAADAAPAPAAPLLVGPRGEPLLIQQPRHVGFDPRRAL